MPEDTAGKYLFDQPGHYQLRVVGKLDDRWLAHLEGLEIAHISWGNYSLVSEINGWLADQIALSGLLDFLTDLGMVILTVERLDVDQSVERSQT